MASAISLVRIAPEAPTRAPAMISTGLLTTKPAIAAAVPVNEFKQRDDDRHVRAADGQHHRHAEDQRRDHDQGQDQRSSAVEPSAIVPGRAEHQRHEADHARSAAMARSPGASRGR